MRSCRTTPAHLTQMLLSTWYIHSTRLHLSRASDLPWTVRKQLQLSSSAAAVVGGTPAAVLLMQPDRYSSCRQMSNSTCNCTEPFPYHGIRHAIRSWQQSHLLVACLIAWCVWAQLLQPAGHTCWQWRSISSKRPHSWAMSTCAS